MLHHDYRIQNVKPENLIVQLENLHELPRTKRRANECQLVQIHDCPPDNCPQFEGG